MIFGPNFMSILDEYLKENSEVSILESNDYLKVLSESVSMAVEVKSLMDKVNCILGLQKHTVLRSFFSFFLCSIFQDSPLPFYYPSPSLLPSALEFSSVLPFLTHFCSNFHLEVANSIILPPSERPRKKGILST